MQYNRLTNDELERRVYIEPGNEEAKAELLRRVPELMDQEAEDLKDALEQVENMERQVSEAEDELGRAEIALVELDEKLQGANHQIEVLQERITELTRAEDLV